MITASDLPVILAIGLIFGVFVMIFFYWCARSDPDYRIPVDREDYYFDPIQESLVNRRNGRFLKKGSLDKVQNPDGTVTYYKKRK